MLPAKKKSRASVSTKKNVTHRKVSAPIPEPLLAVDPPVPSRLASLDAYRGFVILAMIWVNYIGEMPGISNWLKHAAADADTFTFPDLVFPGFLFMVGVAIPLALGRRLREGASLLPLIKKILWRWLGLVLAGVMMVNADRYDPSQALLGRILYFSLFYLSIILVWRQSKKRNLSFWIGIALFGLLMLLFKGKPEDGQTGTWLYHSWWGILGLIGWAYAVCSLVYLAVRGQATGLMGLMALMLVLYMGGDKGRLDFLPEWLTGFVNVGEVMGSLSANVMIGVLVGGLFLKQADNSSLSHPTRMRFMFFFGLGLIAAGLLLRPYHPISKIYASETFTLITGGINLLAFLVFYFLMDVMGWKRWAAFLLPVGTNALLAYIIPDLWNNWTALLGLGGLWWGHAWPYLESGGPAGLLNALVVALFMIWLTKLGGKVSFKLKF